MKANLRLRDRAQGLSRSQAGFGMIEIVVSLFLLSLLTMGFVPLLINSQTTAGTNTTIATATQIVNQQLEGARSVRSSTSTPPSCLDVTKYLQSTLAPVVDPRGVTLQPQWSPTTCPSAYPGVVRVAVSVSRSGNPTPIASAVTFVFVESAT
jgi:type II secretory pathway pseudopilin PulG